jgi:hypothetical protein
MVLARDYLILRRVQRVADGMGGSQISEQQVGYVRGVLAASESRRYSDVIAQRIGTNPVYEAVLEREPQVAIGDVLVTAMGQRLEVIQSTLAGPTQLVVAVSVLE